MKDFALLKPLVSYNETHTPIGGWDQPSQSLRSMFGLEGETFFFKASNKIYPLQRENKPVITIWKPLR